MRRGCMLARHAQQRLALHALRAVDAGALQHGGGDVGRLAQRSGAPGRAFVRGVTPDEGHAREGAIVQAALEHEASVPQHVAVVAGEDDDGVVVQAEAAQAVEDAPDGVVDAGDVAVIERHRLADLALGGGEDAMARLAGRALGGGRAQGGDGRRRIAQVGAAAGGQGHVLRAVQVPEAARRREGMVRVGKGALDEERRIALRVIGQHRAALVGDEAGRIQGLGHARAPGLARLGELEVGRGDGVVRADQALGIGHLLVQPAAPVSVLLVAVADGQAGPLEAVIGQLQLEGRVLAPAGPQLLAVGPGEGPGRGLRLAVFAGRRPGRGHGGDVLQVRLAGQGRAVALGAQHLDEGELAQGQVAPVHLHPVHAGHA